MEDRQSVESNSRAFAGKTRSTFFSGLGFLRFKDVFDHCVGRRVYFVGGALVGVLSFRSKYLKKFLL